MKEKLLVADIGGSKTRIRIYTPDGTVIEERVSVGVASANDSTEPLPLLESALSEVENKEHVVVAAVNLGGRNVTQIIHSIKKVFPCVNIKVFRESEGIAAYEIGKEYGADIILMAGTGAIAVGRSTKGFVTVGGWGANIGDRGGGYDIGLQAISMSLASLDKSEPLSDMTQRICGCPEPLALTQSPESFAKSRDKIRQRIAPLDRQHIASFAKTVAEFAEKGDKSALKILDTAGKNLAELVLDAERKLGCARRSVVITGGLIHSVKFWKSSFEKALCDYEIHYVEDGLLRGAFLVAKDMYEKEI